MDISEIGAIVGLATSAVGLTGKATSTVASIKELFEGDKAPDNSEATKLLNALAIELTSANMMNLELSAALKSLGEELRRQDEFANEVARYELFQTPQDAMVYRLKVGAASEQPMHFICPVCLKRDSLVSFITGTGDYKYCQANSKHLFQFNDTPYSESSSTYSY